MSAINSQNFKEELTSKSLWEVFTEFSSYDKKGQKIVDHLANEIYQSIFKPSESNEKTFEELFDLTLNITGKVQVNRHCDPAHILMNKESFQKLFQELAQNIGRFMIINREVIPL
jgi:hypothetical protein